MAVVSFSGRSPVRKCIRDVACSFSPQYDHSCDEAHVARMSGLTETEVVVILDCIAEHGGVCTLGDIKAEFRGGPVQAKIMALVGAGIVSIDRAALVGAAARERPRR